MVNQRRGKNIAILGLLLQFVLAAELLIGGLLGGSASHLLAGLFATGGLGLWLLVAFLFYCRQMQRQEARELEELAADGRAEASIFHGQAAARPAEARLRLVERWVVPVFTLLWAVYNGLLGVYLVFSWLPGRAARDIGSPVGSVLALLVLGFGSFLLSRYCTGMGRSAPWRLLRATGSFSLACVLYVAATIAAMLAAWQGHPGVDVVAAYVLAIVQVAFAVELAVSFVLELYRPRIAGREERPSFDSRLFGLLAEPGRVGHSIAETLNYQFGFEVSRTWFYQLLGKALIPLIVLGLVILFLMSSLVLVPDGREALVMHWGRLDESRGALQPGLSLKWPWPIDTVEYYDTSRIHEIHLGAGHKRSGKDRDKDLVNGLEVTMWKQEHGEHEERDFLIAVPPAQIEAHRQGAKDAKKIPPVHVIKLVVTLQYRIDSERLKDYAFKHADPHKTLEAIGYREMTRYCSTATLTDPSRDASDRGAPQQIMTAGRAKIAKALKDRIQDAADKAQLGITITYLGLPTVHPPHDAAEAYSNVLAAERGREAKRHEAQGEANRILVEAAGDVQGALQLAFQIARQQQLRRLAGLAANPEKLAAALTEGIRIAGEDLRTRAAEPGIDGELLTMAREHLADLEAITAQYDRTGKIDLGARIDVAQADIDRRFESAWGAPAAMLDEARAEGRRLDLAERARASAHGRKMLAYRANPWIYTLDKYLDAWDGLLPTVTKYVLVADPRRVQMRIGAEKSASDTEGVFQEDQE